MAMVNAFEAIPEIRLLGMEAGSRFQKWVRLLSRTCFGFLRQAFDRHRDYT